ncbi:multifunctional methyltransferase subunit TRM112 [Encephalitozoon hellem]|uniref:Multifunctional methyltransferase subunit TRM112 n=1 Tax=Encephalitozoon hellem TaxID=27973 RepID=A0ABY8CK32_ENCHE|nr:multifunctional methyltransferase subunit TRM112 [Encephalitozoon hellem]
MKPFLLGLLKCKRCSFMTRLVLQCEKAEGCDVDDVQIFNKHVFVENGGERLKLLARSLEGFYGNPVSEEEIDFFVENPDEDERIKGLLFGVDVVEGSLRCDACGLVYPIRNSIVETVDTAESK